jgi:PKHD-type hydroxylase
MIFGDKPISTNMGLAIPRKLSFSLILSDSSEYKGGEFEFDTGTADKAEQKRGRVLAFPSFVKHQVTPIKSGTRKSIVWWALGPKFK